jgi:hypothetical protein
MQFLRVEMISNKKSYRLQSFITFRDLQFNFSGFIIWDRLETRKIKDKMICSGGSLKNRH